MNYISDNLSTASIPFELFSILYVLHGTGEISTRDYSLSLFEKEEKNSGLEAERLHIVKIINDTLPPDPVEALCIRIVSCVKDVFGWISSKEKKSE